MILIIGGAYQGKLDYARKTYGLTEEEIFRCQGTDIDFSRRCIYGLEEYCFACVQAGMDPVERFQAQEPEKTEHILICQDIFCGVVPMDAKNRQWRQETGLLCQYLSGKAERVSRIFCGLEQRLK